MHRAIVELDPLADADRTGAEHQHLAPIGDLNFVFLGVGGVIIGRHRFKFGGAGIDHLVAGYDVPALAATTNLALRRQGQFGYRPVGQAAAFGCAHQLRRHRFIDHPQFHRHDALNLVDKERINRRDPRNFGRVDAATQRFGHHEQTLVISPRQAFQHQFIGQRGNSRQLQPVRLDFQRADRFQQRCFKRPVDCHDFAGRFHLGAQFPIGADKLVKRPAGEFQHDIVDCRFKAGLGFAGHGVLNLVQPIADGNFGSDLGDRIAGRFGRQGAGTADPRIDFDDDIVGALGVERELHVAAAFHAKLADDRQRGRTQHLVFVVGKCLRRGDDDAVAGMYADRVDVFHVADHDTIVGRVTDDFVLDFLPTGHAALDQHLRDHAVGQAAVDHLVELFFAVDDTAAGTAQGIRRSDDQRITDFAGELPRSLDSFDNITDRNRLVDFLHRLFEQFAVFGFLNRLQRSAQQFYVIFFQGTPF